MMAIGLGAVSGQEKQVSCSPGWCAKKVIRGTKPAERGTE
jgi:hypothetical protein